MLATSVPTSALTQRSRRRSRSSGSTRDQAPLQRVGTFPDDASVIGVVGAVPLDQHDDWAAAERRYLSDESMSAIDHDPEKIATKNNAPLAA